MKNIKVLLILLIAILSYNNIANNDHNHEKKERHDSHEGHDHASKKEDHEDEKKAKFSKKDIEELQIKVDIIKSGYLLKTLEYSGELQLNENHLVHINPRFSGFVRTVEKKLGDYVNKGEVLALIDSLEIGEARLNFIEMKRSFELANQDLLRIQKLRQTFYSSLKRIDSGKSDLSEKGDSLNQAIGDFYKSFSRLSLARKTWKRENKLFQEKVNSEESFLAAQSKLEEAQADFSFQKDQQKYEIERELLQKQRFLQLINIKYQSARNKLILFGLNDLEIAQLRKGENLSKDLTLTSLRAPFNGYIIEKHLVVGERITPDISVYTIADLSDYWALFQVYSSDTRKVKLGQKVEIEIAGKTYNANIDYIGKTINEETRSFDVRAVISKDRDLKAGLFLQAKVITDTIFVKIMVPKTSVFEMDGQSVVFVKHEDFFEAKVVRTGKKDYKNIEVLSGLKENENYAKEGGFHIKAELMKGSLGDGHNH
ncbi:MAG: hypothetical protein COB02_05375 [Candidatus Cloacimonadota bacterium]|nr:MAG: hypothetical protein COB02_05375 [Candidatus Cloacimonadota bacterium]